MEGGLRKPGPLKRAMAEEMEGLGFETERADSLSKVKRRQRWLETQKTERQEGRGRVHVLEPTFMEVLWQGRWLSRKRCNGDRLFNRILLNVRTWAFGATKVKHAVWLCLSTQ